MNTDSESPAAGSRQVRAQWALGALLVPLFLYVGYGFWQNGKQAQTALTIRGRTPLAADSVIQSLPVPSDSPAVQKLAQPLSALAKEVVVHVVGAVEKPGVYRLAPEKRIDDAVKAAGGAKANADLDSMNLAAPIEDGSRIEVPVKGEATVLPGWDKKTPAVPRKADSEPPKPGKLSPSSGGHVNINSADAQQLQRLPGVGPAMADRILSHRKENGPFAEPEQLMDVTGIGEKKFARMKPFVRVR